MDVGASKVQLPCRYCSSMGSLPGCGSGGSEAAGSSYGWNRSVSSLPCNTGSSRQKLPALEPFLRWRWSFWHAPSGEAVFGGVALVRREQGKDKATRATIIRQGVVRIDGSGKVRVYGG